MEHEAPHGRSLDEANALLPEVVDHLAPVWPERCGRCGLVLPLSPDLAAAVPERHQVSELP